MRRTGKQTERRALLLGLAASCVAGPASAQWWRKAQEALSDLGVVPQSSSSLSQSDAAAGLREALRVGSERVVTQLGASGGYLLDDLIRIPLPGFLGDAQRVLRPIGLSYLFDDLETRLNRGAERAAPFAKDIFWTAITDMTITDAVGIVKGPNNAATEYLRGKMTPPLQTAFRPVISRELEGAGALETFDTLADRYANVPLAPDMGTNARDSLIDHGLDYALRGMFYYLGKEEAAIRENPARRTSEILRKVFG